MDSSQPVQVHDPNRMSGQILSKTRQKPNGDKDNGKDNGSSHTEQPKTLHIQKVYPPLGYPDLASEPVTGPDLVMLPQSPCATVTPPESSQMGPPLSQAQRPMQRKTDATCQADDATTGQSGDGDTHVRTMHRRGEPATMAVNNDPMTGNRERLV